MRRAPTGSAGWPVPYLSVVAAWTSSCASLSTKVFVYVNEDLRRVLDERGVLVVSVEGPIISSRPGYPRPSPQQCGSFRAALAWGSVRRSRGTRYLRSLRHDRRLVHGPIVRPGSPQHRRELRWPCRGHQGMARSGQRREEEGAVLRRRDL